MIKGKYVALIEINFNIKDNIKGHNIRSFKEIEDKIVNGDMTREIQKIFNIGYDEYGDVKITQQYADLYEVDSDADD